MQRTRVLIAGAAGRDFHNFNLVYRGREDFEVVGFTATQVPNIDGRVYPAELAGVLYPEAIAVTPESDLDRPDGVHDLDGVGIAHRLRTLLHVDITGSRPHAVGTSLQLIARR